MTPTRGLASALVVVVGSVNMDITVQVNKLPLPGETVAGRDAELLLGGKGANQAIAVQRLGGKVQFIARVGDDAFGTAALEALAQEDIALDSVLRSSGVSTGIAMISVAGGGQNMITLSPGANASMTPSDVETVSAFFNQQTILLLQNEIPAVVSRHAAKAVRSRGGLVIIDPAPATGFDRSLISLADVITPNETEAQALTGIAIRTTHDAIEAARQLVQAGAGTALIKLGEQGVAYAGHHGEGHVPTPSVEAINSVAAGDCFNGALAVALGEGQLFSQALSFACRAAAISVTRQGAAASMPRRSELQTLV